MVGVVAAGHPLTAAAGAEILAQGGNAFDGAISATLAAWFTEPVLTSPGGGGFLLARSAQGTACLFDFFAHTPRQRRSEPELDFYPIHANFGDAVQEFHVGLGSVAVPGAIAGLFHVHQRLGRLPMAAIAAPALRYGREGVVVNDFMAYCFELLRPILTATPTAQAIYAPQGHLLKAGETLHLPELADTLATLVERGPGWFYEGELGARLVADCQGQGGQITPVDLAGYRVIERSPLTDPYRGRTLLTNPPPSSGGALIAFTLGLLEAVDWTGVPWGSLGHLRPLVEAMALTNLARRDGYDRHLHDPQVATEFLAPTHLQAYRDALAAALQPSPNYWGSTTHISVLDREGNAASVTTSNGEGSAYVIPGSQIMLNNMLGEADLHPQGFHQWRRDQRISSMMAPVMVLEGEQTRWVLGSGGSNRIRTALVQVLVNLLDFGQDLPQAIAAPRLHWEGGILSLEPGFDPTVVTPDLSATIQTLSPWQQQNMFFGGVHAVALSPEAPPQAMGDPRRGGAIARSSHPT